MDHPTFFAITEDEIDLNLLLEQITLSSTGAAAIFTGMVRGTTSHNNPHETIYLEYEAYKPMAEAKRAPHGATFSAKMSRALATIQIGFISPSAIKASVNPKQQPRQ